MQSESASRVPSAHLELQEMSAQIDHEYVFALFSIKDITRCFPSFVVVVVVVVVVMIAATISDQHVLTIHKFCVPAMVS